MILLFLSVFELVMSIVLLMVAIVLYKLFKHTLTNLFKIYMLLVIISMFLFSLVELQWVIKYEDIMTTVDEVGWFLSEFLMLITIGYGLFIVYKHTNHVSGGKYEKVETNE